LFQQGFLSDEVDAKEELPLGTSFVGISDRGFWMQDDLLELWLRLLALHLEDPSEPGSFARPIRDQWLLASRGYFGGWVPHGLEEAISTSEGKDLVRAAVVSLLAALESAPKFIEKDAFNLMGFTGKEFKGDIETRKLLEIGDAFLDLLDGKITTNASNTSLMPGSK
jgi:hypothetical protein